MPSTSNCFGWLQPASPLLQLALRHLAGAVAATLALLPLVACRTTAIREPTEITVPAGASLDQVEYAVLAAVVNYRPPLQHKASQITEEILSVIAGGRGGGGWFVESREPGVVYAGYQRRSHYLSVAIPYDEDTVRVQINHSEDLSQRYGRIHQNAYVWIQKLERRIRWHLGQVALLNAPVAAPATTRTRDP